MFSYPVLGRVDNSCNSSKSFCGHQPILTSSCREQGCFRYLISTLQLPIVTARTNIRVSPCQPCLPQLPQLCHILGSIALSTV